MRNAIVTIFISTAIFLFYAGLSSQSENQEDPLRHLLQRIRVSPSSFIFPTDECSSSGRHNEVHFDLMSRHRENPSSSKKKGQRESSSSSMRLDRLLCTDLKDIPGLEIPAGREISFNNMKIGVIESRSIKPYVRHGKFLIFHEPLNIGEYIHDFQWIKIIADYAKAKNLGMWAVDSAVAAVKDVEARYQGSAGHFKSANNHEVPAYSVPDRISLDFSVGSPNINHEFDRHMSNISIEPRKHASREDSENVRRDDRRTPRTRRIMPE